MLDLKISNAIEKNVTDPEFRCYTSAADLTGPVELLVMDEIGSDMFGEGVSAKSVVGFLADHRSRDVNVRINSPGGLVYDGLQIFNALSSHSGLVTVTIEGLAFSAASMIAMAGDKIRMFEASDIGIHRAWGLTMGNSKAMKGTAEWLDTVDSHLVDIYAHRTGLSPEKVNEFLDGTDDGTLFNARQAVEYGFADEIIPLKSKAKATARATIANRRVQAEHSIRQTRYRSLRR